MPGYSGTPLPKKLGIKPGFRLHFSDLPSDVKAELKAALADCSVVDGRPPIDLAMIFVTDLSQLQNLFAPLARKLAPAGMLWVSWPKKSSGIKTGLDENKIRDVGLAVGLVDVKVCAVSDVWSGLKFVIRRRDRKSIR